MIKREVEWVGFVLLAAGLSTFLAFKNATRSIIDFSIEGAPLTFSATSFFFIAVSVLMLGNLLFAWMVNLARRDVGKTRFLKRFFGVMAMLCAGAGLAMGARALPAIGTAGFEELADGSTAAVVLLFSMVLMAMFRSRELPGGAGPV